MRYSTFAASLLLSSAAAWRLPDFDWKRGNNPVEVPSTETSILPDAPTAEIPVSFVGIPLLATLDPSTTFATDDDAPLTKKAAAALTSEQQDALNAHNAARSQVGTRALTWDAGLASDALNYARKLAASGTFQHSGVSGQGENLYMQSAGGSALKNAVKAFLDEKSKYHGEVITSSNYHAFGHYTQCVWRSTSQVGMAAASGRNGAVYVVARYRTPGNYIGQKAY